MRRLVAPPLLMFGAWKSVWVSRCWHLGQACDISQGGHLKRAEKSSTRWRTFLCPRFREPPSAPPRPTSHPPTATNNAHHSLAISTRQIRHIRWRSCACQRPDFVRVVCRGTCVVARATHSPACRGEETAHCGRRAEGTPRACDATRRAHDNHMGQQVRCVQMSAITRKRAD